MKAQFEVGDKAVYPTYGVAEVVSLERREIGGKEVGVYVLQVVDSTMTIKLPMSNAGSVGLRELIAPKEIKDVLAILRERDVPRDNQTWNRRSREYKEKISSGSLFEIAEVLRDLSLLRRGKELSFGERRVLETVRGLLIKEVALARKVSEAKVGAEIDAIFAQPSA